MDVGPNSPYWLKAAAFFVWLATERTFAFLLGVFLALGIGLALAHLFPIGGR